MELDTRFGDHADPPVHDIMAQELIRVQVLYLQNYFSCINGRSNEGSSGPCMIL